MNLISCSSCACVAKAAERICPHCGVTLRGADGATGTTTAALVLGLVTGLAACTSTPVYGIAGTGGDTSTGGAGGGASSTGGTGGGGESTTGGGGSGGSGGETTGGGGSGGDASFYGVPGTGGTGGQ